MMRCNGQDTGQRWILNGAPRHELVDGAIVATKFSKKHGMGMGFGPNASTNSLLVVEEVLE